MPACQHKPGLLVLRQGEGGRPISIQRVALLAAVQVGRRGELSLVLVFVAVPAARELDLVQRVSALGDVTLRALHGGVLGFERVSGRRVLFHAKFRRFESFHGVTRGAFPTISPLDELAFMLVLMAIHALLEGDRLLEIAAPMALQAIDTLVFPDQRVLGLGVVKVLV